jgi:methanogenic corrinoid protein MtbC1
MSELSTAMADIEDEHVISMVEKQISEGRDPFLILGDLKKGMDIVGQRFSDNEYFLVELVMSADVFTRAMKKLELCFYLLRKREKAERL